MSNRRKTTDARIEQMLRNSKAELDAYEALEANGTEITDPVQLRKRYQAWRRNRKGQRLLAALRDRQLTAFYTNMEKEKVTA